MDKNYIMANRLDTAGETPVVRGGIDPVGVLEKRDRGGSLLSIRIPVTPGNRQVLRSIRAAEQTAWDAAEKADGCAADRDRG